MNLYGMQETWFQSLGQEDPLEKEMAIHSSSLENPMDRGAKVHGGLKPMGSQTVGHNEAINTQHIFDE